MSLLHFKISNKLQAVRKAGYETTNLNLKVDLLFIKVIKFSNYKVS